MQNREAAEHITESLLAVTKLVTTSVNKINVMNSEGKVSPKEAELYCHSVLDALDKMLTENLIDIFEQHPELRPRCSCREPPEKEKDHD